jgi:dTDP-4-dehydrorhamnose reductase
MEKVLILGGSGLVGKALINEISKHNKFDIYATYFENKAAVEQHKSFKLDINDASNMYDILNNIKPQRVISCLRGNFDKQLILHKQVAEYLKENGGKLYFFSTTNVFDNDLSRHHYEDDLPSSCTDYGQYKIECEKKITEILQEDACILRIPQVWGKDSPRMKQLIDNKKVIVYQKLLVNTNTDIGIAKQAFFIINNNLKGIFHLAAEDVINFKDFYYELIKGLNLDYANIEEDLEEEGCFAILSKRINEFPEELIVTNKAVISYLTGK